MNDNKIDLLLDKSESMESGLKEINSIVSAIRDRQEESDAKFEALAFDTHRILGELTELKKGQERLDRNWKHLLCAH